MLKRKITLSGARYDFALVIHVLLLTCLVSGRAEAILIDRGGGLIYATELDVTWLQNANASGQLTWGEAKKWADDLIYYDPVRDVYWNDWRLPLILPIDGQSYDLTWGYEGMTDRGFNIMSPNSEFAYLYYVSLGNLGSISTDGVRPQPGWSYNGLNSGPFVDIRDSYWSESEFASGSEIAFFNMRNGEQLSESMEVVAYKSAWAVRDGDVVPEPSTAVEIDIKPGSDPNSINPRSRGVIPVAIFTTEDFDALTADADSVLFGPAEAEKAHRRAHVEDVDGDGDSDLVLHFRSQDVGIAPGDTEACLTGQTYDGVPLMGCDAVRTVRPN